MAKVLFLSVLLSVLLSFPVALGDSGWVLSPRGMDHICRLTQERASRELCEGTLRANLARVIPDYLGVRVTACIIISLNIVPKPNIGLHVLVVAEVEVELAPLINIRLQVTVRIILQIGRHGLFVYACAVVDAVIKSRGLLATDITAHLAVEALSRALTGPMCERGRLWCRELNYCMDFGQYPFPINPSCYGVWKNRQPHITENQIELRSQPVCSCQEMENGVSVSLDALITLQLTLSPTDESVYFCHERDISYIFECLRKGGVLNDMFVSVSLTVGAVLDIMPNLIFTCPAGVNIVIKVECLRVSVEILAGHAQLCIRSRVSIGCDTSNFTSAISFILTGCLDLKITVDCRRELLLLAVSAKSALRIRIRCPEGEVCDNEDRLLTELFLSPLTAWCVSHINAKIKGGIRIPFLRHYPCDRCQTPVYIRRHVYCPCTLRYVP